MNYLKIKNVGEIDIRSLMLIGASTKKEDSTKIGQFGTGLKYAISYFLRNNITFKVFKGTEEITFSLKTEIIRGKEFKVIHCNGESMNITTLYGDDWQAWEVIREIWCNAKDEVKFSKSVTNENSVISGVVGWTSFFIELTDPIKEVVENWGEYFVTMKPFFENDIMCIYENKSSSLGKIYKNGVRVKELGFKSIFHYDIKNCSLNELRQFQGVEQASIAEMILKSNPVVASKYIELLSTLEDRKTKEYKDRYFEDDLNFTYTWLHPSAEVIKNNFSGFLYLHPKSSGGMSKRAIRVKEELFNVLKNAGLHCEKVESSSTGGYGGGYARKSIKYRNFTNETLNPLIEEVKLKYDLSFNFKIVLQFDAKFDYLVDGSHILFSSDIESYSTKDLEATILLAYIDYKQKVYRSFKRMIKASIDNKNLSEILGLKEDINDNNSKEKITDGLPF